jgi:hypothetical protein
MPHRQQCELGIAADQVRDHMCHKGHSCQSALPSPLNPLGLRLLTSQCRTLEEIGVVILSIFDSTDHYNSISRAMVPNRRSQWTMTSAEIVCASTMISAVIESMASRRRTKRHDILRFSWIAFKREGLIRLVRRRNIASYQFQLEPGLRRDLLKKH